MAVYGTNIDINVIGNAIDQLQKIQADYMRLKQDQGKKIKVDVDDQASSKSNKIKRNVASVPKQHNIKFTATGIETMNARMKNTSSGFEQLNKGALGLKHALGMLAVAGAAAFTTIGTAAAKGAKDAVDLQSSYKTTENLIVTGDEKARTASEKARAAIRAVNEMQRDGKKYSLEYGVSQQKIADAYQDLVKRGHTSAEALGVMRSELQASVASGDDFSDVVRVSSNTIEEFGMKTDSTRKMMRNTRKVVNDLAYASDATATDFKSMGVAMEYVGSSAHQAGVSLRETSATIGILSNNGLEADKAGTSFQEVLQHITKITPQGTEALKKLGLSVGDFQTKSGKLKSIPEIFSMINKGMNAVGVKGANRLKMMNQIFGTVGGNAANILASNTKQLKELEGQIKKAEEDDYVSKLAKKNSQTVQMEMARAKTSLESVTMELGQAFMPAIASASEVLAKGLTTEKAQHEIKTLSNEMAVLGTTVAKYLVAHGEDLWEIAKALGKIGTAIGKGAIDTISTFFGILTGHPLASAGDSTHRIAESLTEISKLTPLFKTLGAIFAVEFAASRLMASAKAINEMYKGMLAISTLGGKESLTGSLLGDIANKRAGGAMTKSVLETATKDSAKTGIQVAPYLDERGFKGAWKRFTATLPVLGKNAGEKIGTATSKGLLARFAGGLTGLEALGKGIAGKLGAGISIGLSVIDVARGLTPQFKGDRWNMLGKGVGGLIGAGLLSEFGPGGMAIGATVGNLLGGQIAKGIRGILKGMYHFGYDLGEVLQGKMSFHTMVGKFTKSFSGMISWAGKEWKKFVDWWNGETPSKKSNSSHKPKQPSEKVVKSLGGNHYSKTDIANVKAMNKAITDYTGSLKKLKASIKKNDPTKQLNGMNSRLNKSIKSWDKLATPIKKIGRAFDDLKSFNKSMSKNDAFAKLNKDIPRLDKELKKNRIAENVKKLSNELKKSKLTKTLDKMNASLNRDASYWRALAKPIKTAASSFKSMEKSLKTFSGKHNPLNKLDSSVKSLTKDVRKYQFGKELAKQMSLADKSMNGKHSFVGQFTSMAKQIERELRRFKSTFNHDWKNAWTNVDVYPSRALNTVKSTVNSRLNSIESRERGFTSTFMSGWRRWTSSVVSEMRSAFNRLPGIAQRAMQGIISRLNHGISGINSVISDFGGDKKLSTIHYANGTMGSHPGGLAVINDGNGRYKQELVWQPSQGWKTYSGLNQMVTLEPGSQVLPAGPTHQALSALGVPHYAGGTLSDDEEDKIAEAFINNPIKASRDLVLKFTNWNSGVPIMPSLGKASAIGFSRGIANVLKDLLGIIKEPINGDWTPVIKSAARLLHFHISAGQIAKLLRQIQTESGGREVITNHWDSNAKAGHPSQGLLQFIPSTFNTWAVGKYRDINKGFDQILAAINALNHGGEGGWGNIGNGHGWANGGHLMQPQYALVAEDGDEYIINPNKPNAFKLANEAMHDILKRNPNMITRPRIVTAQYQAANIPVQQATNDSNPLITLVKQAVEKLDNINIRPVVDVESVAKPINRYNANNLARMRR